MQNTDTIYLDQKWMNPIKLNPQFIACVVCSKIPSLQNQIGCSSCNRLFCLQDYYNLVCCPICSQSLQTITNQRHIAYKNAFQNAIYLCHHCQKKQSSDSNYEPKNYNYKNFANHIQIHQAQIDSQIKSNKKCRQLFKYELIDNKGNSYRLQDSEQIAINHCLYTNGNFCYFIATDNSPLVIDFKKQEAYFENKSQKMKLIKHKNDVLNNLTQYSLWMYQKGKKKIYFDHYWQQRIQRSFNDYNFNPKFNEIHVQKQNIFLRMNFETMEIIVPTTSERFNFQSQKIKFK